MRDYDDPKYGEDFIVTDWDGDPSGFEKMLKEKYKKKEVNKNGRKTNVRSSTGIVSR